MRLYNSFLVRCWLTRGEGERRVIDIEHVQTGTHFHPSSMADAEAWMRETLNKNPQVVNAASETTFYEDSLDRTMVD